MSETGAAGSAYRLIAYAGARANVYRNRNFVSLPLAHQGMTGAIRADRNRSITAVEVQRGLPTSVPCIDPHAVVPGIRGGWSHMSWETIERFEPEALAPLRSAVGHRWHGPSYRSQRTIMVAGLAAIFLCTSALFGLQTGGAHSGGAEQAKIVTHLPISRVPAREVADRGEPNDGALRRTLESALTDRSTVAGPPRDHDQPSSSW